MAGHLKLTKKGKVFRIECKGVSIKILKIRGRNDMRKRLLMLTCVLSVSFVLVACKNTESSAGITTEIASQTEIFTEMTSTEEQETVTVTETTDVVENTENVSESDTVVATEDVVEETEKQQEAAYTVTTFEAKIMYAKQSVNVRKGPSADYEKLGSLHTNDEVQVIGQVNETSWYQIMYQGMEAFVSQKYLVGTKVEIPTSGGAAEQSNPNAGNVEESDNGGTSESGGHISWSGPGTYLPNIGVSIPTLGAFNKEALNANTDGWAGDDSTTEGHNAGQTVFDTADAIESAVKNLGVTCDTGMVVQNNALEWAYTTYGSMNSFELHREPSNNRYRLEVNIRLCDGTVLDGTDIGPINRDILKYLCSVVSSTPDTLANYIYEVLEVDGSKISTSSWTSVGDCNIKIDPNFYDNHYPFYIKAGE